MPVLLLASLRQDVVLGIRHVGNTERLGVDGIAPEGGWVMAQEAEVVASLGSADGVSQGQAQIEADEELRFFAGDWDGPGRRAGLLASLGVKGAGQAYEDVFSVLFRVRPVFGDIEKLVDLLKGVDGVNGRVDGDVAVDVQLSAVSTVFWAARRAR